jgi:hypothetical protein
MKHWKLLALIITFAISCTDKNKTAIATEKSIEPKSELDFEFIWNSKQKSIADIDKSIENLSDGLALEFVYPQQEIIPEKDSLLLIHKLKQKGFKIIDSGRGNWMNGPRIISYTLESDDFVCRVDKLYYSDSLNSKANKYKVTERFACLKK